MNPSDEFVKRSSSGAEDIFPSFVAISWHGPDYEIALRQRNHICEEFFSFLSLLRKKNWFGNMGFRVFNGEIENQIDFLFFSQKSITLKINHFELT